MKQVDLHGFHIHEVKEYLDSILKQLPKGTREIQIIHGYQTGSSLQSYVRNRYNHARIERKLLSMNPGETIFLLQENKKKEDTI